MKSEQIDKTTKRGTDSNRDPITQEPGAHPVGTGIGAAAGGAAGGIAAGAAAGAAIGTGAAGPIGTAVGIIAGAVVGGLAGKAAAEKIDPTVEDAYWKENYRSRKYVGNDEKWETYAPAYRAGYQGYSRNAGKRYEEVEADLQRDYERNAGPAALRWEKARPAARDAWDRVSGAQTESNREDTGCGCGHDA